VAETRGQLTPTEIVRHFVSLNILLSHPRLLEITLLSRAYVSPY